VRQVGHLPEVISRCTASKILNFVTSNYVRTRFIRSRNIVRISIFLVHTVVTGVKFIGRLYSTRHFVSH